MRSLLLVLSLLSGIAPGNAAIASDCHYPDERGIVMALMNLEGDRAAAQIAGLDESNALIPSRSWYSGLSAWYAAYQSGDTVSKRAAIKSLRAAVKQLENDTDANAHEPGLGIAHAHLARILLEDDQFLRGYRVGMRAVKFLQRYLDTAEPGDPGYQDARFLEGLYEVYSADLNKRAEWVPRSFRHRGNRAAGVGMIEVAIHSGAVFAAEAGRTLLAEVSWRTPDVCAYINIVQSLGKRLPNNADIATLQQGLLLKCGLPARALEVNNQYRLNPQLPRDNMTKAQLRILASLGDVEGIKALEVEPPLRDHATLAMANALDVSGERDGALGVYETLQASSDVDPVIRKVASVRREFPFIAPKKLVVDQLDTPGFATCTSG